MKIKSILNTCSISLTLLAIGLTSFAEGDVPESVKSDGWLEIC